MVAKLSIKRRAVILRRKGYSYTEIAHILKVSKSTCSLWLREIVLAATARARLLRLQKSGQARARFARKESIQSRNENIKTGAVKMLEHFPDQNEAVNKLLCAFLYWSEGEKQSNRIAFTNSDPQMIKTFLALLRSTFAIVEDKLRAVLHLHTYHDRNKQLKYWSRITRIPDNRMYVYNKVNSGRNVRKDYPGCISIRYYDVAVRRELDFLLQAYVDKFGGFV